MNSDLPKAPPMERAVVIDPTQHSGWDSLLDNHAESGFFQGLAWAQVLCKTYGHRPLYFCSFLNEKLTGLLPVMEIRSPLTRRLRAVSLPFTDVCAPLQTGIRCP